MPERAPRYPIHVRFADGDHWILADSVELAKTLEWFDSEDRREEAEVTDALGRPVFVEIERHEILRLGLVPSLRPLSTNELERSRTPMRAPLIFLGPNGSWDLLIFESASEAESHAEPPDVQAGEYGAHGWDADGRPVALEVKPAGEPRGFYGDLLRSRSKWEVWSSEIGTRVSKWLRLQPQLEVRLREIEGRAEPEVLREALTGRLAGLEPDLVEVAEGMALDDLIALVRRSMDERLRELQQGRYPTKEGV